MKYEKTGDKKISKTGAKQSRDKALQNIDSKAFMWAKSKQHKFGLMTTYAVILTVYAFVPFIPGEIIAVIFGK